MPRPKKSVETKASTNGLSTGTTLLHLAAAIDELNPHERELILQSVDALQQMARLMRFNRLVPKIATELGETRSIKTVKQVKPAVKKPIKSVKKAKRRKHQIEYDPNRLVALRMDQRLTQAELAKRLKVHFTTISMAERGVASKPLLEKLSDYFKTQLTASAELEAPSYTARLIKAQAQQA